LSGDRVEVAGAPVVGVARFAVVVSIGTVVVDADVIVVVEAGSGATD
jgi:hypothetical protein